jgi:hypothetical protein
VQTFKTRQGLASGRMLKDQLALKPKCDPGRMRRCLQLLPLDPKWDWLDCEDMFPQVAEAGYGL